MPKSQDWGIALSTCDAGDDGTCWQAMLSAERERAQVMIFSCCRVL